MIEKERYDPTYSVKKVVNGSFTGFFEESDTYVKYVGRKIL